MQRLGIWIFRITRSIYPAESGWHGIITSGYPRTHYAKSEEEEPMPILPYNGVWPTIAEDVFIAPGAAVIGNVTILEGARLWYNAEVRGDSAPIVICRRSYIQANLPLHVVTAALLTL